MKIFITSEKIKKWMLDVIFKIKHKHQADDNKFSVEADDGVVVIDDNDDGIELLAIIDSLGNDEVL